MADAVVTIGGDINELKRRLKEAGGEIKGFGDRAKKDVSGIDFGKALGIAGGIAGLQRLLTVGFRFNQTMGDSETAVANIIQRFQGLNAVAAKDEAKKAMEAIVALEPKTAATLEGLTQGFLATFASAQQAGISIEENIDLVGKFSNALANANIPADQLVQELRSIFTGNITSDSALAKMLEIRPQDVAAAKEMGQLYEFLNEKVGELGVSGDTAGVAFSSLASAMDKALGLATEGLFKQSVNGAKDLSKALDENADGFRAVGELAAGAMSFVGATFGFLKGGLDDLLIGLDEITRMIIGLPSRDESEAINGKKFMGGIGDAVTAPHLQQKSAEKTAEFERKAAMAKEQILRIARDLERVERMREELGEREFQRILKHMTPLLQVEAIQRRIAQEKERQANEVGPRSEGETLENQKRLVDLEDQLAEAVRRRGEAQVTAAREAADAAEDAAEKTQALMDVEKEMALLEAQAAGKKKEAAAIEREMAVEQTKRAIMSQTGLGEDEAQAMAEKMQKLREKADERDEKERVGGPSKTKGYSFAEQGDRKDKQGSLLDGYNRMQQDRRLNETFEFPGLEAYRKLQEKGPMGGERQNPAEALAAKNAKEATSSKDLGSRMDKLIEVTTRGLLGE